MRLPVLFFGVLSLVWISNVTHSLAPSSENDFILGLVREALLVGMVFGMFNNPKNESKPPDVEGATVDTDISDEAAGRARILLAEQSEAARKKEMAEQAERAKSMKKLVDNVEQRTDDDISTRALGRTHGCMSPTLLEY